MIEKTYCLVKYKLLSVPNSGKKVIQKMTLAPQLWPSWTKIPIQAFNFTVGPANKHSLDGCGSCIRLRSSTPQVVPYPKKSVDQ